MKVKVVQSLGHVITNDQYKIRKLDLLILSLILLLCIPFVIKGILNKFEPNGRSRIAEIYHENIKTSEIDLREDGIFPILSGKMLIEVKSGRLRVIESDCPNHLCMKMGPISSEDQTIICIPNKVLITIKGDDKRDVDSVTY